ncbi:MAG TPA: hypothetical protein VFG59_05970 [Anaeromyxobacter sp.]|nr:hypothetical protein [Anaeromyxobacter sp.]
MSRRRGRGAEGAGINPVYEGPEVLTALLRKAGSPHAGEEVAERFQKAQEAGESRSAVIPSLFPEEPRFETPEDARRLYANLFGLWARLAAGLGPYDDAPDLVREQEEEAEPLPERGSQPGNALSPEIIEGVWTLLADSAPREIQRRRDRWANVQPDLVAWLENLPVPDAGVLTLRDLAFEAWSMFDHAFGERLGVVEFRDLRDLESEPPLLTEVQPSLAGYVAEQLDLATDEDPSFDASVRAEVERALTAAAAALTSAVVEPS